LPLTAIASAAPATGEEKEEKKWLPPPSSSAEEQGSRPNSSSPKSRLSINLPGSGGANGNGNDGNGADAEQVLPPPTTTTATPAQQQQQQQPTPAFSTNDAAASNFSAASFSALLADAQASAAAAGGGGGGVLPGPSNELVGVEFSPLSFLPHAPVSRYLGRVCVTLIKEVYEFKLVGGLGAFVETFLLEMHQIVRAHVLSRGGNALLAYNLQEFKLQRRDAAAYAILSCSGDAALCIKNVQG
jgi:hypothetical protein